MRECERNEYPVHECKRILVDTRTTGVSGVIFFSWLSLFQLIWKDRKVELPNFNMGGSLTEYRGELR